MNSALNFLISDHLAFVATVIRTRGARATMGGASTCTHAQPIVPTSTVADSSSACPGAQPHDTHITCKHAILRSAVQFSGVQRRC